MASPISDAISSVDFQSFLSQMYNSGWFTYFFPFLLVYSIVFTILERVDIFKGKKSVKIIVAFVFSLVGVAFPVSDGLLVGDVINTLFPGVTVFGMGILSLYIIAGMFGVDLFSFFGDNDQNNDMIKYALGVLGVIWIIFYFGKGMGWWQSNFSDNSTVNFVVDVITDPLLWIIVIIYLTFKWVSDDGGNEGGNKESKNKSDSVD